jgi:hypothetical protein
MPEFIDSNGTRRTIQIDPLALEHIRRRLAIDLTDVRTVDQLAEATLVPVPSS